MLDFVNLEGYLGEESRMIRDSARELVEDRVNPEIGDHFESGTVPTGLITEMG